MSAAGETYAEFTERKVVNFHLGCIATLLPYDVRLAALEAWRTVDPSLFLMDHDPPAPVVECVLERGSKELQVALARFARSRTTQNGLLDLDDPDVDAALVGTYPLHYETECRLRIRNPAAVAARRQYHQWHHRNALVSADPALAAAALIDQRDPSVPTMRAAAWSTVRRSGGTARVREVVAALPADVDPVSSDVRAACAEAAPGPFLDTVEERRLGTGALLRRLRAVPGHPEWQAEREVRSVLKEPYRIDWALVTAARLGGRLPRTAARVLLLRPDCPPEVAVVLRTGRPARPGRPLPPPAPAPPPADPGKRRPPWVPEWQPPGGTGPLGESARSARQALRTMPVSYGASDGPTVDHLAAVIEREQLSAAEVASLARPAQVVTSWVGQSSGHADVGRAAWSGRAALHVATAALIARWTAGRMPVEQWAALRRMIRTFQGPVPELLDAVREAA